MTLYGTVGSILARDRAASLAKGTDGPLHHCDNGRVEDGRVLTLKQGDGGDTVGEADVDILVQNLLYDEGRPVLVLEGEIPMYRDLRPGSRGIDVEQLELALERLGHFEGTPDEVWGSETADALQAWYGEAGYAPEGPTEAELAELEAAVQALLEADDE